jgi:site-specific DNA recombinase
VRDILTNPKYTGHMVWNRRARSGAGKNRVNPVSEWVWSVEPTHEALISLEPFVQAQHVSARRERSRTKPGLNPAPESKRVFRLCSYTSCVHCHRRLFGNANHAGTICHGCRPKKAYRPDGHPPMFRVREDELLIGANRILAHEVFAPTAAACSRQAEQTRSRPLRRNMKTGSQRSNVRSARTGAGRPTCFAPWKSPPP